MPDMPHRNLRVRQHILLLSHKLNIFQQRPGMHVAARLLPGNRDPNRGNSQLHTRHGQAVPPVYQHVRDGHVPVFTDSNRAGAGGGRGWVRRN